MAKGNPIKVLIDLKRPLAIDHVYVIIRLAGGFDVFLRSLLLICYMSYLVVVL